MGLHINISEVESTIAALNQGLSANEVEQLYSDLISGFTRSEGEQADALRGLQAKEKSLAGSANQLLSQFATSIQMAVIEMVELDRRASEMLTTDVPDIWK